MKRSNYITRIGWDRLDKELKFLWKEERPKSHVLLVKLHHKAIVAKMQNIFMAKSDYVKLIDELGF